MGDQYDDYHMLIRDRIDLSLLLKIHKTDVTARTEIGDNAKLTFKALGMAYPKKVLSYENENLIAIRD